MQPLLYRGAPGSEKLKLLFERLLKINDCALSTAEQISEDHGN